MVCAFLLEPDVARVVVGKLHDEHAFAFRQRRGNLLDELLLSLDIHGGKQFVLVDRLKQLFVFVLALVFRVGKRRQVAAFAIEAQLGGAAVGKLEQLF